MAFLRKSLSQDAVDGYCDTWTFLFLSLLAINFLFLPLAPQMTLTLSSPSQGDQQPGNQNVNEIKRVRFPKYKGTCWCPAHFHYSLESYAENACSSALNSLAQGKEFVGAGLYLPFRPDFGGPHPGIITKESFWASQSSGINSNQSQDQSQTTTESIDQQIKVESLLHDRDKFLTGTKELILFKTPLFLLVLAICLRLPHAIWALLSTCSGCMNVDRTLAAAQQMCSMDVAGNRSVRKELYEALGKSSRKSASLLYLLMKLLMFVVLLVGFKVNHDLVRDVDTLEKDWNKLKLMQENAKAINPVTTLSDGRTDLPSTDTSQSRRLPFDGSVLLCDFSVRAMENVQTYTMQCLFTVDQGSISVGSKTSAQHMEKRTNAHMYESNCESILLMYKCLFTIVLSLIIVMALLTISSLVVWCVRLLVSSCRANMGLKGDEALDVVFIVAMAWMNASPTVAMELAKCTAVSDKEESEGEAFELH